MSTDADHTFIRKLAAGEACLGVTISFTDPTVTEAVSGSVDFVWIDMEHNALSLETVQGHVIATKGSDATPIVRVAWNDPVLIKPVLDLGAAGVIVPMVRTAEEARGAVAACRYPPEGVRGFGPRRPSNYGRLGGPEFCQAANRSVIPIIQIEHIDAIAAIDEIAAVPGIASLVVGPNDLAGSMGHMGHPDHPEVMAAAERVIAAAQRANIFVGFAFVGTPAEMAAWIRMGMQWVVIGTDWGLLLQATEQQYRGVHEELGSDRQAESS